MEKSYWVKERLGCIKSASKELKRAKKKMQKSVDDFLRLHSRIFRKDLGG